MSSDSDPRDVRGGNGRHPFSCCSIRWVVSSELFLIVTVAEVSAVNVWAAVFGALTGGLGALLLANIGGEATIVAQRPGMASRWPWLS